MTEQANDTPWAVQQREKMARLKEKQGNPGTTGQATKKKVKKKVDK